MPKAKRKARATGDSAHYRFVLHRGGQATDLGFDLLRVTHVIKAIMGPEFRVAAYYGFNLALDGVSTLVSNGEQLADLEPDDVKELLKVLRMTPYQKRNDAGNRGTKAHKVLEKLALGELHVDRIDDEHARLKTAGGATRYATGYDLGVVRWFAERMDGWEIVESERTLWSLAHGYCGTADLIRRAERGIPEDEWSLPIPGGTVETCDLKTHNPALENGPAYDEDRVQMGAYEGAGVEMHSRGQLPWRPTVGRQRVIIATEDGGWTEDTKEGRQEDFLAVLHLYRSLKAKEAK